MEHYYGPTAAIPDDQFEEPHRFTQEELTENKVKFTDGYSCTDYQNWNEFAPMIPEEYMDIFADMDMLHVPIPTESYCKISVIGTDISSEVLFMWKDKKMLVFDNDNEKVMIQGWTSLSVSEIWSSDFVGLMNGGKN